MIHKLMSGCKWAQNRAKLERAIKEVRGDNDETGEVGKKEVTENEVLVVYRRLLGFVIEGELPKKVKSEVEVKVKDEEVAGEDKKRGRPAKE